MKVRKFEILILLFFCICETSYSQKDSIKIEPIIFPEGYWGVYYVNTKPVLKNGQPYTGLDSSLYTQEGEKLKVLQTFKDGFKTELRTYFDNGNLECHYQWKNGKRDGISKRLYKSGKTMYDYFMKEGQAIGPTIHYYENGKPHYISDDLLGWNLAFYKNGKTKSYTQRILDVTICGDSAGYHETEWQENGQLSKEATYNCGRQPFKLYWNDTIIAAEGINATSFGYILVGKYTERYENGKLKIEGIYSETKPGMKNGEWKYYDETGKLILTEYFENDIPKKSTPDKIKNKPKPFFDRN